MLSTNEKITMRQLQILIILGAMGTGVIVLPRRVAEFAGQDGWVIVVGLTVMAMVLGLLISAAAKVRPGAGFVETTGVLLTRPVAVFCGAVLWAKLVLSAGLELRVFLNITREVLLPQTPVLLVSAVMLAVCAHAAAKGIETRARIGEVLLYLMILPFVFLLVVALLDIDFSNLQPVLAAAPDTLFWGTLRLGFVFTGLEMLLLVGPFLQRKKNMGKAVAAALGIAGIIITAITVITIAKFGQGVVNQPWPVLAMMDMLNLPGMFIERQEALMFSFWIVTAFVLVNAMLFFGGVLVKDVVRFKSPRRLSLGVLITAVSVFAVTAIPLEGGAIYRWLDVMYVTLGLFFLVVLPLLLLAAAKFAKPKGLAVLMLAIISISLASCHDMVEIEDRAFIVAMGIDKAKDDGRYMVTLSVPPLQKESEKSDEDQCHIKYANGHTITEALKKLDAKTDRSLYYGHSKLLVLGEGLLKDADLMRGAISAIDNNSRIDRRINVLAAKGKAQDILKAKPPGEILEGIYISEIYRDKSKIGGSSFSQDFERLCTALQFKNGAMIPMIERDKNEGSPLKLTGAAAISDYHKKGTITEDELRGFLWAFTGGGEGAIITLEEADAAISMKVEKHTANVKFEPIGEEDLRAILEIHIKGRIEEGPFCQSNPPSPFERENICQALAAKIAAETATTATKLQAEIGIDGYDWLETLRKKHHPLYQKYAQDWPYAFAEMEIVPEVVVEVRFLA